MTGQCTGVENPVFAGRACYLDLGGDNRAKLIFTTMGHADHYEALKVTVLNRMDGEVDALVFRFGDIWGAKPVRNPNFPSGVKPHIWSDGGSHDWYIYLPTDADFRQLAAAVIADDYHMTKIKSWQTRADTAQWRKWKTTGVRHNNFSNKYIDYELSKGNLGSVQQQHGQDQISEHAEESDL